MLRGINCSSGAGPAFLGSAMWGAPSFSAYSAERVGCETLNRKRPPTISFRIEQDGDFSLEFDGDGQVASFVVVEISGYDGVGGPPGDCDFTHKSVASKLFA